MPQAYSRERLTLIDVAERLQVHISTVYRWTYHGVRGNQLRSFLIGGRRYVRLKDLDRFLESGDLPDCPLSPPDTTQSQLQSETKNTAGFSEDGE